ncbi:hypothetical protein SAMN05421788_109136 [Filimonas lacunae]|uniref:GLPGLI family protein n=1 Tax=Filimonas lacunae TaxID=477680 RepID=A0A1N7R4S1_9BACT|nr:hypothetical protein [Filimonas lacunae]SIT30130.1 hypothetical protein SAMN05421788_109136 [Filimonas lacunae]
MKSLLLATALFSVICAQAQLSYNSLVKKKYQEAMARTNQKRLAETDSVINQYLNKPDKDSTKRSYTGLCIYTDYVIDTLNKKEWRYYKRAVPEEEIPFYLPTTGTPFGVIAELYKDTLWLNMQTVNQPHFNHWILKGQLTSRFLVYERGEKLQLALNAPKTDFLEVPYTSENIILSTTNLKGKEPVYGKAEVETAPFYTDNESFLKGYMITRVRAMYYFKFTAIPAPASLPHSSFPSSTADRK